MKESSIIVYNRKLVDYSVGTPTNVEFGFEKLWNFYKNCNFWNPKDLNFYHVHPFGYNSYSATDLNCMEGFRVAFGHPINFHIVIFQNKDIYCLKHELLLYKYSNKDNLIKLPEYSVLLDERHLIILKLLSIGGDFI